MLQNNESNVHSRSHIISIQELEANIERGDKVCCPQCSNDNIVKKSSQVDLPKAVGFIFLIGASFAIILVINIIVMVREKMKRKKLHPAVRDKLKDDGKISVMGLHVPIKTSISCDKCGYKFYENFDTGDFIVVLFFFIIVILVVFGIVYYLLKRRKN
jgi:preprotein translocase subunit YajC